MKRNLTTIDRSNHKIVYLVVGAEPEAERIPMYNQLLRNVSPKFKRLVEGMDEDKTDLDIRGVSKSIMRVLIEYIYQTFEGVEASLPISDTNVYELAFAANKYELEDVQAHCHNYLESININEENCIQLFVKTSELTSKTFKSKSLEFLLSSLNQLMNTPSFVNLSFYHLIRIMHEGRAHGKCSEDLLCKAVVSWIKNRSREISTEIKGLIDEFPCKEHKRLIIEALFEIPNPEMQKFAFSRIMDLYKNEIKTTTTTVQPTLETDAGHNNNDTTKNGSTIVLRDGSGTVFVKTLKRSSPPSKQETSSDPHPTKKNKTQPTSSNNEYLNTRTTTAPESTNGTGSNSLLAVADKSSSSSCERKSPNNGEVCVIYFLAPHEGSYHLLSLDLHHFTVKTLTTTVPPALALFKFPSVQCYQGHIYFIPRYAGSIEKNTLLCNNDHIHIFDMEEKSWTIKKMPQSYQGFQSVRLDSSLFVIGGLQKNEVTQKYDKIINSIELLDLNASQELSDWKKVAENSFWPRAYSGLVVSSNKIYSIGGLKMLEGGGLEGSGLCTVFDPRSTEKEACKVLPAALSVSRHGLLAVHTGNGIYAIGGKASPSAKTNTVEILRAGSEIWEVGPSLINPRAYSCGGYCKEQDAIFVFGGDVRKNPTVEKLDLKTNKWSLVGDSSLPYEFSYGGLFCPCT